jgi:acyl-CoA synthetase (AMP-forming)/AMP-acid ligase II
LVAEEIVYTNDIAEILPNGDFRILGRKDNIINSGGIKIRAEEIEDILRPVISGSFAITPVPHSQFGEAVVLLITRGTNVSREKINKLLPKYKQPKYIVETDLIPLTETGKTDRAACKRIAEALLKDNA